MPLPVAPIALTALRVAPFAAAAYVAWRSAPVQRRNQHVEDALDEMPEGFSRHADTESSRAGARMKRSVRLGRNGPGIEIDAAALGRLRFRRV
ncbi:MAG: hypothetical protein AAGF74_05470 [Pseudomonadota bacterium]